MESIEIVKKDSLIEIKTAQHYIGYGQDIILSRSDQIHLLRYFIREDLDLMRELMCEECPEHISH